MSEQDLEVWLQVRLMMPILVLTTSGREIQVESHQKYVYHVQSRKRLEQTNINEMIRLASVPVGISRKENYRNPGAK